MLARHAAPVALAALALAACRTAPAEPTTSSASAPAEPRAPVVHVIAEADHRSKTDLLKGDIVELPHDADFAWTIKFENGSYFDPAPPSPAGVERYVATRTGIVRTIVTGEPKICMRSDAACTLATYAWQVTFQVD